MKTITEEELKEINILRSNLATTVNETGQLSLQISLVETELEELKKKVVERSLLFKQLLADEQILVKGLSEKYGTGSINFETGEFTPE